ncbi:hypothetical protein TSUD_201510 [Trifolium subterraneum]|uniref:Uncharacterized protein n=1 Tax=Trifolium subterraneum TaxID=3900 RepID=A0A2Z6MQI6_TRISU|nr:hypothetical protein TSUD_201510 [Trifolium subterraneum]
MGLQHRCWQNPSLRRYRRLLPPLFPFPRQIPLPQATSNWLPSDSDSRFVYNKLRQLHNHNNNTRISLSASSRVLNLSPATTESENEIQHFAGEEGSISSELICKTLYAWEEAVSPHLAAEREGFVVKDSAVLETLHKCFSEVSESGVVQVLLVHFNVTCIGVY